MGAPTCTTADVARLILERVGDPGGDFTADTHPTVTQVTALIANIAAEVVAVVGATVPTALDELAELTVATGVAASVELAFTDATVRDVDSKYDQLKARYDELLARLDAAAQALAGGGSSGDEVLMPWAQFPDPPYDGSRATTLTERY